MTQLVSILSVSVASLSLFAQVSGSSRAPRIQEPDLNYVQFRLVADSALPETEEVFSDPWNRRQMIQLEEQVLLNLSEVTRAEVRKPERGDGFNVWLVLTSRGAAKLRQALEEQTGRRLGILVDGALTAAPRIFQRVSVTAGVPVYFGIREAEAKQQAEYINGLLKSVQPRQ